MYASEFKYFEMKMQGFMCKLPIIGMYLIAEKKAYCTFIKLKISIVTIKLFIHKRAFFMIYDKEMCSSVYYIFGSL